MDDRRGGRRECKVSASGNVRTRAAQVQQWHQVLHQTPVIGSLVLLFARRGGNSPTCQRGSSRNLSTTKREKRKALRQGVSREDLRRQSGSDPAETKRAHCTRTSTSTSPLSSSLRQMLAHRHARREVIEHSSELLFRSDSTLISYPPPASAVNIVWYCLVLRVMPPSQCPVLGCGLLSHRWGKKSYPLPSADILTLQLDSTIDISINHRICQPCWERHKNHTMKLDGRTRVHPISSPSPLDALLSAAVSPLPPSPPPLPSPSFVASLPPPPPTPARVITPFPAQPIVASYPLQVQHSSSTSPATVPPQSQHSPIPVPPQSHNSPTPATQ